jgi:hypothetical protein
MKLRGILWIKYRIVPGMHVNRIGPDEVGYRQIIAHALVLGTPRWAPTTRERSISDDLTDLQWRPITSITVS